MAKAEESISRMSTRNLSSLLLGKLFTTALTGLIFIINARLLGPVDYGLYTLAVAFSTMMDGFTHFGIGSYFNKHLSEANYSKDYGKMSKVISNGYTVIIPIAFSLTLLSLGLSGFAVNNFLSGSGIKVSSLMLASLTIFFSVISGAAYSGLIGLGKGWKASLAYISQYAVQLLLSVVLIEAGFGVNGALTGLLAGYVTAFIIALAYMYKAVGFGIRTRFTLPALREIKSTVAFSLPVAANNFIGSGIPSFATFVLGIFATTYVVGNYGAAYKLMVLMLVVAGTISAVLVPTFSMALVKNKDKKYMHRVYNKALLFSLAASLPIMAYVGVFSQPLTELIITKSYLNAPFYVVLMSLGVAINLIATFSGNFFLANGKVNKIFKYNLISGIFQALGLVVLVPRYGVLGLIVALYYVGPLISSGLFVYNLRRIVGISLDLPMTFKLYLVSMLLAAISYPVLGLGNRIAELVVGGALFILVYPAVLAALGILNKELIEELRHATHGIPFSGVAMIYLSTYSLLFSHK